MKRAQAKLAQQVRAAVGETNLPGDEAAGIKSGAKIAKVMRPVMTT